MPFATRGFTLHELLVCLAISAILLSIGVPGMASLLANNQQTVMVNQLLGALHYARGTALTTGVPVSLCAGKQGCDNDAQWQTALWIFHDPQRLGALAPNHPPLRVEYFAKGYSWHWKAFGQSHFVQFRSNGRVLIMNGTFTLCRNGQPLKQIVLNTLGRSRVENSTAGAPCSPTTANKPSVGAGLPASFFAQPTDISPANRRRTDEQLAGQPAPTPLVARLCA